MSGKDAIIAFIESTLLAEDADVRLASHDNLLERAPVDSIGVVKLVNFLEQRFEVKIQASEVTIKNFQTVDDIFALIERKRAEA